MREVSFTIHGVDREEAKNLFLNWCKQWGLEYEGGQAGILQRFSYETHNRAFLYEETPHSYKIVLHLFEEPYRCPCCGVPLRKPLPKGFSCCGSNPAWHPTELDKFDL